MGKVEQPFEHLTDAQIEHYGEEQPGAGPDQNQKLEAHLADCSGCRGRVLAFHRARFTPGATSRSTPRSMSDSALTAARRPDCPPEDALRDLAAGLTPPHQAAPLIQHAAQCAHCGPILSAYTEDFSDDLTPEDQAVLAQLESASPKWQKKLVRKLQGSNAQSGTAAAPSRSIFKLPWFRWVLVPATTAACAAIAFLVWYQQRDTPEKVEKLLAQAYTEQRTMEMRWPGAEWAKPQVTLGPSESLFSKPSSLFRAEDIIKEHHREFDDVRWVRARAQAEILEGQSQAAIHLLGPATEASPNSIPLLLDLALAYSEEFKRSHDPKDSLTATNLLKRVLNSDPQNRAALFNLAIAYENSEMWDQVVSTWEAYLRIEPTGPWADEAKDKLATAKTRLKSTLQLSPTRSDDVASFASLANQDIAARSEQYQQLALQNWAAAAAAHPASLEYRAVARLAMVSAETNSDMWWHDFLHSASGISGIADLAAASVANVRGYYIQAARHAAHAAKIFHAHGNLAGELRARYESVYAHRRLLQIKDCLARADPLEAQLAVTRYAWLQSQLAMERAVCLNLAGQLTESEAELSRSSQIARSSHLPLSLLRSIGFAQGLHNREHRFGDALNEGTEGLRVYWTSPRSTERIYQLYAGFSVTAEGLALPAAAEALMRHAVEILRAENDKIQLGAALLQLSKLLAAENDKRAAEAAATEANQLFESESQEPTSRRYRLVAKIGLADLELQEGNPKDALATLEPASTLLSETDGYFVSLDYYRVSGNIHLALHELDEASSAYETAILNAERALTTLKTERERLHWVAAADSAYRGLVRVLLEQRHPEGAWKVWEWYASRSYPQTLIGLAPQRRDFSGWPKLWSMISSISLASHESPRIVYAVFDDGVQIWMFHQRELRGTWVPIKREKLETLAQRFSEDCASKSSPLREVQRLGQDLFALLVQPISDGMKANSIASIELDAPLSNVPFEALRSPKGWYLAEKVALVYSSGILLEQRLRPRAHFSSKTPFLLADASSGNYLPGRDREVSTVLQTFPSVTVVGTTATLTGVLAPLRQSTIFGFIGHAEPNETGAGLRINPNLLLRASDFLPQRLGRLQLAVLAACSTGSSGADGLMDTRSLVHAFLSGGVPDVISSRWNVDSESTSVLMSDVYSRVARNESAPIALFSARTHLLEHQMHPYFWAGFTVTGRAN